MLKQATYSFLLIFLLSFIACKDKENSKGDFDQIALLSDLTDQVILPTISKFESNSTDLNNAIQQLAQSPNEQNLLEVQNQWKNTMLVWKKCQLFNIGEVEKTYLENRIQKWPINTTFIEGNIADTVALSNEFIEGIGSTAKGLSAIEYLIFNPDSGNTEIINIIQNEPRKLSYLSALGTNLVANAKAFNQTWNDYTETFKSATGNDIDASLTLLTNGMISELEKINKNKISNPAGLSGTVVEGDLVEAKRSEFSKELITSSLENLKSTFISKDTQYIGFDDYLDFLGAEFSKEPLSEKILSQIDKSITSVNQINGPLNKAVVDDAQNVAEAQKAILQLLVLIKVDMASSLSATITFSDSDGD